MSISEEQIRDALKTVKYPGFTHDIVSFGLVKTIQIDNCDIYGPSISLMFGTRERPTATDENMIVPIEQYGLRLMSMGFLLDDTSPAILRGPMVTRYTQQFLRQVEWGELDYLVLDLPPG